jgi:general secretion pathway protein J
MRSREDGYTIAEMLASLVILGFVSALIVSGLMEGRRVWERMNAANEGAETVGGAQLLLRQRIERAYPVTLYDQSPPYSDFTGESNSLVFLAPPRPAQAPSALRRYKLWLSPGGELMLSSVSDLATDATKANENLVLLTGVQALDLAYFGPNPKGGAGWQLQWKDATEPPQLIRVHVQFEAGDGRLWPDLLVRPITTIDSGCVLNTATGRCRGRA